MSGHANLPCHEHVLFENAAARQAHLRTDNIVLAHHGCMAYLHEAIDLGVALHASFADGRAIDGGERLHLDVVLDDRDAGLHDLVMRTIGALGEAETIATDDGAVLQDNAVADAAKFAHHGVRMGKEIVANLGALVDHGVGVYPRTAADRGALPDYHERAYGRVPPHPRANGHGAAGVE